MPLLLTLSASIMSSSCCPPGSWPALEAQSGSYNGKEEDLGDGVKAYVVKPTEPTGYGLISFQDIFQYDSARCKGVADQFAAAGFAVVHVDFVGAQQVYTDDQNLYAWVKERSYADFIKPKLVSTVIPYLKEKLGADKIVATGFCWGSYIAFQACADPDVKDSIVATALFHPTLQLNAAFDKDPESKDIAKHVTCPTLFVPAGNDPDFVGPEGSVMKILQAACPESKSVVMKEMKHGFVIRGDVSDPAVKRDVKQAIEIAVAFLTEHAATKA